MRFRFRFNLGLGLSLGSGSVYYYLNSQRYRQLLKMAPLRHEVVLTLA